MKYKDSDGKMVVADSVMVCPACGGWNYDMPEAVLNEKGRLLLKCSSCGETAKMGDWKYGNGVKGAASVVNER